ncbi:MAG: phosphate signaling complex protein PhoU [Candidatus Firestonebacteria bacterium]
MFDEKMIGLKKEIVEHAGLVESMIAKSIKGLLSKDKGLLSEVINKDELKSNNYEIEIDELCTNIIAQYEPKARDLRIVLMILKMNNDLERIGDHAVNISQSCIYLLEHPLIKIDIDISQIANISKKMLNDSITSFLNEDIDLAKNVCKDDTIIDNLKYDLSKKLITFMASDPKTIKYCLNIMRINNNLERIADLSTNICEEVIFISEGRVIKHHKDENAIESFIKKP